MHVLMVPSWYPADEDDLGGSFFREQAKMLADSGHRVGVLAAHVVSWPDVLKERPRPSTRWSREAGVTVGRLDLVQIVPRARTLEALLVATRSGAVRRAMVAYVERFGRPDVLHAQSLYPGGYLAHELSKSWGIPWVLTEHRSLDHLRVLTPWGARRETQVVSTAAVRCGVSVGHARHLARRFGTLGGAWEVLHNPVSDAGPAPRIDHPVDRPVIGHLSSLAPVKRPELVVEAFALLRRQVSGARLTVAGPVGGPQGEILRAQVSRSASFDAIELLGLLSRGEVAPYLANLDVLLMPSDSETFGVAMAEALAQGTPVVATATWGACDVVGRDDGEVVPVDEGTDPALALAGAMKRVLDSETGDGAARRASRRRRSLQRFGADAFVRRCEQVYREAQG